MTNQIVTRGAEWGHWGIHFISWVTPERPYACQIHGCLYFPVGVQGPVDAMPGQRDRFRAIIKAWQDDGVLPEGLDTTHAKYTDREPPLVRVELVNPRPDGDARITYEFPKEITSALGLGCSGRTLTVPKDWPVPAVLCATRTSDGGPFLAAAVWAYGPQEAK